ncbi:L,D-transpeptidase scaffold domain-containing protein [Mucilaginibacter glaciei]|uniref:L,D-transpeptidase scaffold domain-containing protein n=1 Tax=Mucilaginibacter glaciei TaxID=2772109 RepID=A0A926S1P4_9SPHI|nr:hypothetical protein [Mucilaginibacter glaciei]MBD1393027.1 hypothetical protein [Mucilaginibacter glaciei]
MQKPIQLIPCCKVFAQVSVIIGVIFLILALTVNANAANSNRDTSISASLKTQLADRPFLNYPRSVERFYKDTRYQLAWIAPDTVKTHAWDAMLLLDCALHYGLSPTDFHPRELLYERLNAMTTKHEKVGNQQKAAYDILLTDAMITMINNLHFGKLNPVYTADVLDKGNAGDCRSADVLITCLKQKDFMTAIENTQPVSKAYLSLQRHMRLITGQQALDCYETPPEDIQIIAINMERLRWINRADTVYISIDIPSYTLKFHQKDTTYQFKAMVGKPETPTALVQSNITAIIKDRVGITFKLSGNSLAMAGVSPRTVISKQALRALSDGTIQIPEAPRLAALILKNNRANLTAGELGRQGIPKQMRAYTLKKPIPVRVTYLTCAIGDWGLIRYKDVYELDQRLTNAFYQVPEMIARRSNTKYRK